MGDLYYFISDCKVLKRYCSDEYSKRIKEKSKKKFRLESFRAEINYIIGIIMLILSIFWPFSLFISKTRNNNSLKYFCFFLIIIIIAINICSKFKENSILNDIKKKQMSKTSSEKINRIVYEDLNSRICNEIDTFYFNGLLAILKKHNIKLDDINDLQILQNQIKKDLKKYSFFSISINSSTFLYAFLFSIITEIFSYTINKEKIEYFLLFITIYIFISLFKIILFKFLNFVDFFTKSAVPSINSLHLLDDLEILFLKKDKIKIDDFPNIYFY